MDRATTQRLWGAAVLIAIAVIFLPMLVKGPAPDSGVRDVPLDIPKASTQPQANVQELPLGEPGTLPASGAVGFDEAEATESQPQVEPAAIAAGDYAINFGNYATAGDAQKVIAALAKSNLDAYSDVLNNAGKTVYRVRIGPYATRAAAEAARIDAARVNAAVKTEVVALNAVSASAEPSKPVATAPATTPAVTAPVEKPTPKPEVVKPQPSNPPATASVETPAKPSPKPVEKPAEKPAAASTGFIVQIGAFSHPEEAQKLRDRARAAGFSATTESVKTDNGVLTRVKLGPATTRQSADALRASAQSKLGVAGVVRSQP